MELEPAITITSRMTPPKWALMQRQLIEILNESAEEFTAKYTRPDGTLIWRDNWPGMDGSDDPYEAFMNFALLYALGGSERVYELACKMWDAITWQWTQYGQIHDEFDAYYDWMHHGEGNLFHYFFGLTKPDVLKERQRAVKFAELYTGDHPEAANYDKEKKLMRSPITGSKGPRFEMTEEDWVTHRGVLDDYLAPFEDIPGVDFASGTCQWSDDRIYREIIQRMNERMAKGDVPLNLNATSLMAHAYMYTQDDKYKNWVTEYLAAWEERTARNGGLTPDNVGLNDQIGEYHDGKWWGGYYGWRWAHGFQSIIEPLLNAGMNAVLLTGDDSKLDLTRAQLDRNWELGRWEQGEYVVPHRHFDQGWTDYRSANPRFPIYLWYVSMKEEDAARVRRIALSDHWREIEIPQRSGRNPVTMKETKHYIGNTVPWFLYMQGEYPDYPEQILDANYKLITQQLDKMRSPAGDPHQWDWDHPYCIHLWQEMCPVYFESLVQLMLGAPMHVSHGGLQYATVRYFDARNNRPGLPESVSALVHQVTADTVILSLVNTSLFARRHLIIQAGGFGEHCFTKAEVFDADDQVVRSTLLNGKWLPVQLDMGSGAKLRLTMKRYHSAPTYATPWSQLAGQPDLIQGRASQRAGGAME